MARERALERASPYPEYPGRPTARFARELVASVLAGTCPVLLDHDEARIALGLTVGIFDDLVRQGVLVDYVMVGERQLFLAAQIREMIRHERHSLVERVAGRDVAAAAAAREALRERRREAGQKAAINYKNRGNLPAPP